MATVADLLFAIHYVKTHYQLTQTTLNWLNAAEHMYEGPYDAKNPNKFADKKFYPEIEKFLREMRKAYEDANTNETNIAAALCDALLTFHARSKSDPTLKLTSELLRKHIDSYLRALDTLKSSAGPSSAAAAPVSEDQRKIFILEEKLARFERLFSQKPDVQKLAQLQAEISALRSGASGSAASAGSKADAGAQDTIAKLDAEVSALRSKDAEKTRELERLQAENQVASSKVQETQMTLALQAAELEHLRRGKAEDLKKILELEAIVAANQAKLDETFAALSELVGNAEKTEKQYGGLQAFFDFYKPLIEDAIAATKQNIDAKEALIKLVMYTNDQEKKFAQGGRDIFRLEGILAENLAMADKQYSDAKNKYKLEAKKLNIDSDAFILEKRMNARMVQAQHITRSYSALQDFTECKEQFLGAAQQTVKDLKTTNEKVLQLIAKYQADEPLLPSSSSKASVNKVIADLQAKIQSLESRLGTHSSASATAASFSPATGSAGGSSSHISAPPVAPAPPAAPSMGAGAPPPPPPPPGPPASFSNKAPAGPSSGGRSALLSEITGAGGKLKKKKR